MQKITSRYRNLKRISLISMIAIIIFSIASVVPVFASPATVTLDFDSLPTGSFVEHQEDGFRIHYIGFGDLQTISNEAGNNVLKDSAYNVYGAEVYINSLNGGNFYFNSLDYNNFNNNSGSYTIHVWAFPYPFDWGTATHVTLSPTSSVFSTLTSAALGVDGIELCQIRVNIVSSSADYSVDNISLTPANTAVIDVDPDTLNLNSKGLFTTYISLDGYDVADVDISTVTCGGASAICGVIDGDVLVVKFKRQDLVDIQTGDAVELTLSGNLLDGRPFSGSDTIRVMDKGNN